ncbi:MULTISPECIES: hypothetical protein [Dietzia]|uniref:hypothetical protein n=1 Tax=Dietzia TaxID=37914 RepID=UPI0033686010
MVLSGHLHAGRRALTITARATEFHAQVSTATADAAVVDLIVDGTTVAANLALSTLGKLGTYWITLAHSLSAATHTVTLQLKSGTLRPSATAALTAPAASGSGSGAFTPGVVVGQLAASTSALPLPTDGGFAAMANSVPITLPSGWSSAMLTIHGYAYLMGGSSSDVREIETQVLVGSDDTRLYATLPAVAATQRQNTAISVTMPLTANVTATVRSRAFSAAKTGLSIPAHRLHYTLVRTT